MYNIRAEGVQFRRRYCSTSATRGVQLGRRNHIIDTILRKPKNDVTVHVIAGVGNNA